LAGGADADLSILSATRKLPLNQRLRVISSLPAPLFFIPLMKEKDFVYLGYAWD
jgi:hypothetical protein